MRKRLCMMVVGMCLAAVSAGGCGQDADGRAWWNQAQDQQTPADNRQLQDTMGGHDISPFVVSQTDAAKLIDHTLGDGLPDQGPVEDLNVMNSGDTTLKKIPARYVQVFANNTLTYNQTASTTPTATATAAPTVTGTQSGTQSPTTSPTYRVDPGVAVPVAVGLPGSAPTATGNAVGSGSGTQETSVSNQLTTELLNLAATDPSRFAQVIELLRNPAANAVETPGEGGSEIIEVQPGGGT
jgi:hypothetical protein